MKVKERKLAELKPAEYNPRKISDKQLSDLKKSFESFGTMEPAVVNIHPERKDVIISGHQRVKVAQSLGHTTYPCIEVNLSERKEKELNVRMNRNTGEFDFDILVEEFDVEDLVDWGFDEDEFEDLIDVSEHQRGRTDDDEVPEASAEPTTKPGDLYQLGEHRLLCGDALLKNDVDMLLNNKKINICITDPPYGVSYANKNKYLNAISRGNRIQVEIENDHISEKEIMKLWCAVFTIIKDNLDKVNSYYVFGPQIQGMMMMMMMMQKAGLPYRHVIIWVKNNHVLGRCDYNYKHEPILYGWTNTHKFYGKGEFKTSVWPVDKPHKSDLHPTMKPIRLIENALLNSSEKGNICYDPFGGSGSTLIACEKLNRKCRMMEIDPTYCDVIVKRWEGYTGNKAQLIK